MYYTWLGSNVCFRTLLCSFPGVSHNIFCFCVMFERNSMFLSHVVVPTWNVMKCKVVHIHPSFDEFQPLDESKQPACVRNQTKRIFLEPGSCRCSCIYCKPSLFFCFCLCIYLLSGQYQSYNQTENNSISKRIYYWTTFATLHQTCHK